MFSIAVDLDITYLVESTFLPNEIDINRLFLQIIKAIEYSGRCDVGERQLLTASPRPFKTVKLQLEHFKLPAQPLTGRLIFAKVSGRGQAVQIPVCLCLIRMAAGSFLKLLEPKTFNPKLHHRVETECNSMIEQVILFDMHPRAHDRGRIWILMAKRRIRVDFFQVFDDYVGLGHDLPLIHQRRDNPLWVQFQIPGLKMIELPTFNKLFIPGQRLCRQNHTHFHATGAVPKLIKFIIRHLNISSTGYITISGKKNNSRMATKSQMMKGTAAR